MNIILLLGIALITALGAGRIGDRFGVPQVVGYIVAGLLLGNSGLNIFSPSLVDAFSPVVNIVLALIGFMVGAELKYEVFRRYGWQFFVILLCEGILTMLVVTGLVWWLTGDPVVAVLLGALSSATAPAATVDVLWQYKSRGPVTTTILAIVALDDGLSLILYGFAFAIAESLYTGNGIAVNDVVLGPFIEILGSLALGCGAGFILDRLLLFIQKEDDRLVVILGCVLMGAGLSERLNWSLIMVAMAIGCWLTNTPKHHNEKCFEMIKAFTPPIYTLFFVLVGARLRIDLIPQIGSIGLMYVLGRTVGKWSGAYLGARLSGAAETVRRYLGLALFSQAGVALGLALHTFQYFSRLGAAGQELGGVVINVIAATTLIVQIIGPVAVKFAITKAGEIPRGRRPRHPKKPHD